MLSQLDSQCWVNLTPNVLSIWVDSNIHLLPALPGQILVRQMTQLFISKWLKFFFSVYHSLQTWLFKKKKHSFWALSTTSRNKCEKTVFFHVFCDTLYKVRIKCKNNVFWAFCTTFLKTCEKTVLNFFTFFATLCTKLGRAHTKSTRHESTRSPPPLYPI